MRVEIGNAGYMTDERGGYIVFARWNERARFKQVGSAPVEEQAKLWALQMQDDASMRCGLLRETKDWDFVADRPQPILRRAREKFETPAFHFDRE